MALFCIIGYDAVGSAEKREIHKETHIKYLQKLNQEKRLLTVGPFFSGNTTDSPATGSLYIVDFDTLEEARTWFEQDAYYQSGIYKTLDVRPYIDAMPYC